MRIAFISNFMNHHQAALCDYLFRNCEEFRFISIRQISQETLNFGYDDLSNLPYVFPYRGDPELDQYVRDADVVICGADSERFIHERMKENKVTFIYSERLWKKGLYRRFIPSTRRNVKRRFYVGKCRNLFVLCASCFLPYDLSLIGFPVQRCFKWGYFTPFEPLAPEAVLAAKPEIPTFSWCARFIPLKHFEDVLKAVFFLHNQGYLFRLIVIGSGKLLEKYQMLIARYGLEDVVFFRGNMAQRLVREEMKKSHIFLFSSDFHEGWGAVVNEAMNCLCVPIVSHAAGSSGFLIEHGKNGFVYQSGNVADLSEKMRFCLEHMPEMKDIALHAYQTIAQSYNGEVAAQRLLAFCDGFFRGERVLPEQGPMSEVKLLKNDWVKTL